MAKTNYSYEKRSRELEKQKKQEEKRLRRQHKKEEEENEEGTEADSMSDNAPEA